MLRQINNTDIITAIFIACLLCIAISKLLFGKRFDIFSNLILTNRYIKAYIKEQHFFETFDALLFINLILNGGIFIYIIQKALSSTVLSQLLILKYAILLGSFFIVKVLIERLLASVFKIDHLINSYLFNKISYRNYLGLILLPVNAILIYYVDYSANLLYILGISVLAIYTIILLTYYSKNLNLLKQSLFYFILYLCALEIAPYIIVYQFIAIK
ncbi:hypothetical protein C7H62_0812 [Mesoflavibacter sp. HG96]|uniref:DUF4271 domain-containing protein n=1 Tax=Mesoflavibacter TaxID=444051 RepID=UPI000D0F03A8|nr:MULTISPECIES: DUF4271 domain-containing protein [Mesoflavibacter]QIJ88621.1 hypothetical protein C7H62_0812 [Mesoflavibacter sp. HG96]QIJ91349.1 hypothetical protein C7H56_0812 [Mesoflavibacter sp. HG37]